jgi:hypothetical protein
MAVTEPRDVLIQALAAKWIAAGTLTGIAGPYRGEKPTDTQANPASGTHFPYCVVPDDRGGGMRLIQFTCGNEYWEGEIQFRVYNTTQALCAASLKLIDDVFRPGALSLTMAQGSLIQHRHIATRYVQESKSVWYGEYEMYFMTSRPIA